LVTQPIVKRLSWGGPPGKSLSGKAIACRLKALTVQEPMHGILLVGSLVAGLGFRVAPEWLNLRVLLPFRRALPVAGAAAPWFS
jgi:hypothetical protein